MGREISKINYTGQVLISDDARFILPFYVLSMYLIKIKLEFELKYLSCYTECNKWNDNCFLVSTTWLYKTGMSVRRSVGKFFALVNKKKKYIPHIHARL